MIEEEVHRIVAQEIEKLPEEQRKVVYFHMEGKNNFEIAEIMQISAKQSCPPLSWRSPPM